MRTPPRSKPATDPLAVSQRTPVVTRTPSGSCFRRGAAAALSAKMAPNAAAPSSSRLAIVIPVPFCPRCNDARRATFRHAFTDFVHDRAAIDPTWCILTIVDAFLRLSPAIDLRFGRFGAHEIDRAQAHRPHASVTTKRQAIARFGLPRLDRIPPLAERPGVLSRQRFVKCLQLGRIVRTRPPQHGARGVDKQGCGLHRGDA